MKNSLLSLLRKPSATRYLLIALLILAFLGFLDASYLTILHYKNAIPPCTLHGCEVVLTSKFATLFGIPLGLFGALYYLAVIVMTGIFLQGKNDKKSVIARSLDDEAISRDRHATLAMTKIIPSLLLLITTLGLLVGMYLVYLQAFVLHAFCQYCLTSEFIDFLLFDCAWWLWREQRNNPINE